MQSIFSPGKIKRLQIPSTQQLLRFCRSLPRKKGNHTARLRPLVLYPCQVLRSESPNNPTLLFLPVWSRGHISWSLPWLCHWCCHCHRCAQPVALTLSRDNLMMTGSPPGCRWVSCFPLICPASRDHPSEKRQRVRGYSTKQMTHILDPPNG